MRCSRPSAEVDGAPGIPIAGSTRIGTSKVSLVRQTNRGAAAAEIPTITVAAIHVTRDRTDVAAIDSVAMI
jgi:hypothetical protein